MAYVSAIQRVPPQPRTHALLWLQKRVYDTGRSGISSRYIDSLFIRAVLYNVGVETRMSRPDDMQDLDSTN